MSLLSHLFGKQQSVESPWSIEASILQFIHANTDEVTGKVKSSGQTLPDQPADDCQLKWAPGAMDGVMGHHGGSGRDKKFAGRIAKLAEKIAAHGKEADQTSLYSLLRDEAVLSYVDPALQLIAERQLRIEPHLNKFARRLVSESPDRGPVKFGVALLGLIGNPIDKELVMAIGAHEEFTLYSSVALSNMFENPEKELWSLARRVDGWGRIELVERLFPSSNPDLKRWLLTEGYKNSIMYEYLTYAAATQGELKEALSERCLAPEVLQAASEIIDGLISGGPAEDMYDYEESAATLLLYLKRLSETNDLDLNHFLVVHRIAEFVDKDEREPVDKLRHGWTAATTCSINDHVSSIKLRSGWKEKVQKELRQEGNQRFWVANQAAKRLEIDTFTTHQQRVEAAPEDSGRWFDLMHAADQESIDEVIALAEQLIPLEKIATGPADEMGLGPEYANHSCLGFVLQDLDKYPGKGTALITTSLQSPVIRDRNMALKALNAWREIPAGLRSVLSDAREIEPDEDVRESMIKILNGESLDVG